ncbi:MAG: hypothetical protein IJ087_13330, partial [Eggerthellaceae bacterium]|nr:hypothetical protein [Eggerthellaceae bacterium]
ESRTDRKDETMILCPITRDRCFEEGDDETFGCAWSEDGECHVRKALEALINFGNTISYCGDPEAWIGACGGVDTYEQNGITVSGFVGNADL